MSGKKIIDGLHDAKRGLPCPTCGMIVPWDHFHRVPDDCVAPTPKEAD